MTKKTAYILPILLSVLLRKVDKLNKRASKLGLEPVALTTTDSWITTFKPNGQTIRKVRVDVEGSPVFLKGWEYLGSVRRLSNGEVLLSFAAPEYMREAPTKCDHCHTNRRRSVTVALRNVETGKIVQVGRTCLADYLDDSDAVALADWLGNINEIVEELSDWDNFEGGSGQRDPEPETLSFLATVEAVVARDGFYRKQGGTANDAYKYYMGRNNHRKDPAPDVTKLDYSNARAVLAWARALETDSGYLRNLKAALAGDTIDHRATNLAASATAAHRAALNKEKARQEEKQKGQVSAHFGEVGARSNFSLIVSACRVFTTEGYGYSRYPEYKTAVSMTDEDGNLAVWFATGTREYRLGEAFQVKATVKKHGIDRRGNKQTVLTRCTFPKNAAIED